MLCYLQKIKFKNSNIKPTEKWEKYININYKAGKFLNGKGSGKKSLVYIVSMSITFVTLLEDGDSYQ